MNIFFLDSNIFLSAFSYIDSHVVKLPIEIATMCSVIYQNLIGKRDENVYKPSHQNHPVTKWTGECQENMQYTLVLGLLLCSEYEVRYKKEHSSYKVISYILKNIPRLPSGGVKLVKIGSFSLTPPALAMPDKYKSDDPIQSYRDYYIAEKTHRKDGKTMMVYTERQPPDWLKDKFVFESVKNKFKMKERK